MDFIYDLMYPNSAKRNAWAEISTYIFAGLLLFAVFSSAIIINKVCEVKTTVEVYEVNDEKVVFETRNGMLYAYELGKKWKAENFEVGEEWEIKFFDYETMSPYDDEIVEICGRVAENKTEEKTKCKAK